MEAMANAGALRQFERYARENGLALETLLDDELKAILAASATADRVPAHALIDMMQICSVISGRADLGAAAATWANFRGAYGPLSLLWDHAPSFKEATRVNERFVHTSNAAVALHIEDEGEELALQHILMIPLRYGGSQFIEASLALELRVARMVLGEAWSPVRIEFDHPAPSNTRYHRTIFRCPLEFGADRNAMIILRCDFTRQAVGGNPHMFAYLEKHLESLDRDLPEDLQYEVEQVVAANIADGQATLEHVAQALALSERTLQRHLAAYDTNFANILDKVRQRIVVEYFRVERRPNIIQLAHRLGYSDATSVSRYLRKHFNAGARALRNLGPLSSNHIHSDRTSEPGTH
ncbi:MAG TPA: AraC family transcriptional regulator ligand-binding domain-containing protein [Sphingobium sp.]|uniref:AraC family transcriptional regulator ligand-binding domain-containing protein n=1 Tax=Sphingobium sp. TaxID=1912891 RepID=UPI002ED13B90